MVDLALTSHLVEDAGATMHVSVLLKEVQMYLNLPAGGCLVDATLGLGGHSAALAAALGPQGRIIGIDRDGDSLALAAERLAGVAPHCDFVHDDFRHIDRVLDRMGITEVDGILMDLGISSYQLDNAERGFSLQADGPLDMRMDQDGAFSAYDLINSLSEREIASILRMYGEERLSGRIARFVVEARLRQPIETTNELRDVVVRALPVRYKRQKIHPATRTFQALRIAVNRELESLEQTLEKCVNCLRPGGRICVIAFHSLEDRIVKTKFREFAKAGLLELVVKKPVRPSEAEISVNPRARSACLRVGERLAA